MSEGFPGGGASAAFGLDLGVSPSARPGAVLPAPVDEAGGAGVEVVVEGVHAQGGAVVGEHAGREPVGQAPGGVGGGVLEGQGVAVLVEGPAAPGIALDGDVAVALAGLGGGVGPFDDEVAGSQSFQVRD